MNHLFINKNLTQLWQAKHKVKDLNYEYIWTNNVQIFARKKGNPDNITVKTENDLNKLQIEESISISHVVIITSQTLAP